MDRKSFSSFALSLDDFQPLVKPFVQAAAYSIDPICHCSQHRVVSYSGTSQRDAPFSNRICSSDAEGKYPLPDMMCAVVAVGGGDEELDIRKC